MSVAADPIRGCAPPGEAARRVHRTRQMLIAGVLARALLFGFAAAMAIIALAVLVDVLRPAPRSLREMILPLSMVAALATSAAIVWRHRFAFAVRHVVRWVEEREPRLDYALLTALDPATGPAARRQLERVVDAVRWEPVIRRRIRAALGAPLALLGILGVMLLLSPTAARARVTAPAPGDVLAAPRPGARDAIDPLSPVVVTVAPPAYARRPTVTLENPVTVPGLAGSTVTLRGRATTPAPRALLDSTLLGVRVDAGRWTTSFRMPRRPAAIRLGHRAAERLLVLEPTIDSAPVVTLERPASDTVLSTPAGRIELTAALHDDIGITTGGVEYIVSSGSGESFTFRSGTLSTVAVGGRPDFVLAAPIVLDSLALAAGDVVHFRAFARDGNTVTGPSTGFSETRAIRIARTDERDSVAVDPAPPPEADASLVSQRMLIILTEALEARRPRMARPDVVVESRRLAADQKKLRRSVGDIIFTRLGTEPDAEHVHGPGDAHEPGDMTPAELLRAAERANAAGGRSDPLDFHGDESPIVAINRPLLEAYNHMWDASRELDIGEPARALPPMRAALAAIQRARQAERIYLRGRAAPVIVDIAAVRLQGKDTGRGSPRSPRVPLERQADLARFSQAMELLDHAPAGAIDSLMLLRVELLVDHPAAAASLGEAVDLLRAGRDATMALGRTRRALLGAPVATPGLGRWSGGW